MPPPVGNLLRGGRLFLSYLSIDKYFVSWYNKLILTYRRFFYAVPFE